MATINRDGFSLLSGSEDPRGNCFSLKYWHIYAPFYAVFSLTLYSIIFVHGLRGHPRRTWTGTRAREGNKQHDASVRQRKELKSFWGLRKAKRKPTESSESTSFTTGEVFWPDEYLVPEIPEARIWSYGYNADFMGGFFQVKNKNSVSQHGRDLAVRLEREIENEVSIPIIAGKYASSPTHRNSRIQSFSLRIV